MKKKIKSMSKRTLAVLLTLVMLVTMIPVMGLTAFAAVSGDYTYTVLEDGTAEITNYLGDEIDLVIPEKINGYQVTSIGDKAFQESGFLKEVTISNGVKNIGDFTFYFCKELTDITIPDSVTDIGTFAFGGCIGLTSVTLPDRMTRIGNHAFDYCINLVSINIPDGLTNIAIGVFDGCTSLDNVNIPCSVTSIDNSAFDACKGLTNITIPVSVTTVGESAFNGCTSLNDVYYGGTEDNWNNINFAGGNVPLLKANIHFDGETENPPCEQHTWGEWVVTTPPTCIERGKETRTCSVCGEKETREIPSTDTHNFVWVVDKEATCGETGSRHEECAVCGVKGTSEIIPITGPHNKVWIIVKYPTCDEDGESCLKCDVCGKELSTEKRPEPPIGHDFDDGTVIQEVSCTENEIVQFKCKREGCGYVKTIDTKYALGHNGNFNVLKEPTCTEKGEKIRTCTRCGIIESQRIPANGHTWSDWTVISESTCVTDGVKIRTCTRCGDIEKEVKKAFGHGERCVDTKKATCTKDGFRIYECVYCGVQTREEVLPATGHTFGEWNYVKPTCDDYGLQLRFCTACGKIESKKIPALGHKYGSWIIIKEPTETETGSKQRKCNVCGETAEEVIPALGKPIASGYCGSTTQWKLDSNGTLTIIGTGIVKNYNNDSLVPWNQYAEQIERVVVEEGITRIGEFAFYGCTNLESVTLPASLREINGYVFKNCSSLTEITLPANLEKIGDSAFYGTGLAEITIPATVKSIGYYAFSRCYNLKNVEFTGNAPVFYSNAFNKVVATVTYPSNDATWTADKKQQYGGTLIWEEAGIVEKGYCGETTTWSLSEDGVLTISGTGVIKNYNKPSLVPWNKYAEQIKSVVVEEGVTRIGEFAFYDCINLTSVSIADSVTEINGYVFKYCSSLAEITLPSGLTKIGDSAFYGTGLKKLTIPANVNYVGWYAFSRCYSLTEVEFFGSAPELPGKEFNMMTATVYYPAGDSSWNNVDWSKLGGTITHTAK